MKMLISVLGIIGVLYLYWRYYFFFRDPERSIPGEENLIVSPADGTLIYIKEIADDNLLFSTKQNRIIRLQEFCTNQDLNPPCYLVGIFMHPTSVHVNRAPIAGRIENIDYLSGKNLPMTLTWWRVNLKLRPYDKFASHLLSNERNIITITGKIKLAVIQIADIYVNKIECWVKEKEPVSKGQRIGIIKLGSQVDLLLPKLPGLLIKAQIGQKIKAGESIIAAYNPEEADNEASTR
jgi:phosphatidylserine decarboxylase